MPTKTRRVKDTKRKGADFEREIVHELEGQGYLCTRSGGSLGLWDIIAINNNSVVCIQAKRNRWPAPDEMVQLRAFKRPRGVRCQVWRRDDGEKEPRVWDIDWQVRAPRKA